MMDKTIAIKLENKALSAINVLVIAESQRQRRAFSDTLQNYDFNLIGCIAPAEVATQSVLTESEVDIWLIDSNYDDDIADAVLASDPSAVIVGFNQAPYISEALNYAKWQRKLIRKLTQLLGKPLALSTTSRASELPDWRYVVFLGASMGGPSAVKMFLDNLSPTLPICILLAHHFNQNMIATLPRILNRNNDWNCQIIASTQRLRTGSCLIAPIDQQIVCDSTGRVILQRQPWEEEHKPAIAPLLKNTSDVYGSDLISIIFSGVDKTAGRYLEDIQDNNSQIWAQEPSSSTYPEQPQAIIDSGYCQFVGTPKALAAKLTAYINEASASVSKSTAL